MRLQGIKYPTHSCLNYRGLLFALKEKPRGRKFGADAETQWCH